MTTSEICIIMKYELKLQSTATDAAHNINKAYGDNTVNQWTVQRWLKRFKPTDESLENNINFLLFKSYILFRNDTTFSNG